jgi:hypothetical protein
MQTSIMAAIVASEIIVRVVDSWIEQEMLK